MAETTINQKKVNNESYVDGYRDRRMHPTKGITNATLEAEAKLKALKTKIK